MNYHFKPQDRVSWNGVEGVVLQIVGGCAHPLRVFFPTLEGDFHFTLDGRYHVKHLTPSLVLLATLPTAKSKVRVPHWPAVCPTGDGFRSISGTLHPSLESAQASYGAAYVVRLATEYPPILLETDE